MKKPIPYELVRSKRKSIAIQVYPGNRIQVSAPRFTPHFYIEELVKKKSEWIKSKQKELNERQPSHNEKKYISGELFSYLGTASPLLLKNGPSKIIRNNNNFVMTVPPHYSQDQRKRLLIEWYRKEAKIYFALRLNYCLETCIKEGISSPPEWTVRNMKRRWGSSRSDGKICLNLKLLKAPSECIDYVIYHELCHMKEHNHSIKFYSHLGRVCPDWKAIQKKLNDNTYIRNL